MNNSWTTCANALGQVLKEWRISKGISLYTIAKYGVTRVESVQNVEKGVANMESLANYLDYIYTLDEEFFDNVLYIWQDKMKGWNKGTEAPGNNGDGDTTTY